MLLSPSQQRGVHPRSTTNRSPRVRNSDSTKYGASKYHTEHGSISPRRGSPSYRSSKPTTPLKSFAEEIAAVGNEVANGKPLRDNYLQKFVLQNRLVLALLTFTCFLSLFISFYVDIKILDMFDDPALARATTTIRSPSHKFMNFETPKLRSRDVLRAAQDLEMQPSQIRDLLNLTRPPKIVVEGDFDSHSGIAIANNNMKASLNCAEGKGPVDLPFDIFYEQLDFVPVTEVSGRPDTQVTIRSGTWLPLMIPGLIPSKGWFTKGFFLKDDDSLLVYQLPWEFTVIPNRWVKVLTQCVDRVWVPSLFVRDAYIRSGLPADIIDVVPHAINDSMWSPQNVPYHYPTKKKFVFLFVSGMLHRKGIDVLLEAFTTAFTKDDDVSLYLHSAYSGESKDGLRMQLQILADIQSHLSKENAPEIVLDSDAKLSETDYFGLYTGADAYLLPFRGEGFALTVFEAALSNLPIITTDASPITDFLNNDTAYLVPAKLEDCKLWPCSSKGMFVDYNGGSTIVPPQWWLPSIDSLVEIMRHVVSHPDEAKQKAKEARRQMLAGLGLAGRRAPYVQALEELVAHRAKENFSPRRKSNPICTSSVEYEFVEDDMDKADQELYDHLASIYESTGLGAEVKEWYQSLHDSAPSEDQLKQWKAEQLPSHPGAKGANIGLCTFPNSGTSWTLNLLKGATGVLKHTLYPKECNQTYRGMYCQPSRLGFAINETGDEPGRMPLYTDPILVKTHMAMYGLRNSRLPTAKLFKSKLKNFDRVVRLVRHPLDNFIARVNLEVNNNRCGEDVSIFECLGADFFSQDMERYFAWHRAMDDACKELNLPIITVVYEDLLKDTPPNLEHLLNFMGIKPPDEQVRHATERWKPIHKPNAKGYPGYLLKYDETLLKNISVVFHKLLHRNFKETCVNVGEFLKNDGCVSENQNGGNGKSNHHKAFSEKLKKLHKSQRTYGITANYKDALVKIVDDATSVVTRIIQQTDEIVPSTCTKTPQLIQAVGAEQDTGGMLPRMVIIGSSRSGVRTLFDILRHNGKFAAAGCRDTQFFSNMAVWKDHKDWALSKRRALYKSFFMAPDGSVLKGSTQGLLAVDASLVYFEKPNVPQRLLHIDSQMGIGLLLRNPSYHFISRWLQKVESRSQDISKFENAHGKPYDCMNVFDVQREEISKCFQSNAGASNFNQIAEVRQCVLAIKNDLSASLYVYPLSLWTDIIENPNQYFILQSEELFEHPVASVQRIALFTEVQPFEAKDFHLIRNIGHGRVANEEVLVQQHDFKGCVTSRLNDYFEPFNKLLRDTMLELQLSPLTRDTWTHW